ncbi:hypothetical protein PAXRUDRAFT_17306 [Paxillus rubicundulus Ve08.2h10]|uniref:Uncharacterized protein n=1 Tax=Paxillus rubicundulus Ve08.2h10 TaxID=930991 RepID=A0A0D0C3H0_9AGAM|nr:hypothetical protein PAXRUDRAFT_17306 [Paxillus rubicundulus Ve08.2h10]
MADGHTTGDNMDNEFLRTQENTRDMMSATRNLTSTFQHPTQSPDLLCQTIPGKAHSPSGTIRKAAH